MLFTDEAGRAVLAWPIYEDDWEIVGGLVEQDEPLRWPPGAVPASRRPTTPAPNSSLPRI
ncbi:hypothetical protein ACPPVO_27720 [Dactylosporangium sp. McL0621]|uniref:hypothetical protein n=1 Tax=Dactylosporangium sp. McL0621 TaxID=3415678 RepID=UPI003CECDE1E